MNPTILLVVDNYVSAANYRRMLELVGYVVWTPCDEPTVLDLARRGRPALILMDIDIPTIDCLHTARTLKEDRTTRHIPILALSGEAVPEHKKRSFRGAYDGYLTRRMTPAAIVDEVGRWAQARKLSESA